MVRFAHRSSRVVNLQSQSEFQFGEKSSTGDLLVPRSSLWPPSDDPQQSGGGGWGRETEGRGEAVGDSQGEEGGSLGCAVQSPMYVM
jgi:hypothetical protein